MNAKRSALLALIAAALCCALPGCTGPFDVPADGGDLAISCDLEAVHGDIKLAFVAFDDEQVETLCEGEASGGLARTLAPGRYALTVVAACRGGADVIVQANASDGVEAFIPGDALDDSPIPVTLDPLEA
mgnify:FL=1